jgi:1,4-dihydroxy-2-naphthoyl-CoA hydrolase
MRPEPPDPTETLQGLMPLARTLGITVVRYEPDEVRARLAWSASLCTAGGMLHGGVIMALADTTGAACAFLNLPSDAAGTTTIESKTNFLRAVHEGHVEVRSRPLHVGRTVIVVESDVFDAGPRLVARITRRNWLWGEQLDGPLPKLGFLDLDPVGPVDNRERLEDHHSAGDLVVGQTGPAVPDQRGLIDVVTGNNKRRARGPPSPASRPR